MYPIAIIAAMPAAIPSAPSRKLNALTNRTMYKQVPVAFTTALPERGITQPVCTTREPATICAISRIAGWRLRTSSIRPGVHTSVAARSVNHSERPIGRCTATTPNSTARAIATPPNLGIGRV